MDYMKVRTRGGGDPRGKARVYFTCHPDDVDKYFDKVCEDIFRTQDCAIYYTADMTAPIPEMYRDADLGQMNLFVMPVTFRLLHEKNRAMDSDFEYAADEKHLIPVLPLMMETGIDEFFKNRFGERQYLSPYTHDLTAISYEEKLKKYLESILLDDKTTERIRKAFDAYIFLSYRKKDRHHANELMGLIHKNPLYRDVAIWYDEFLIPGENFNENIDKALKKSDLFAMLVTPNLVNEKNYVQTVEYPNARKAGKTILPAEMVRTDRAELKSLYPGLPDCVDAHGRELDDGALDALKTISLRANEYDPEHCYLIGLAYLEGIDVEVNKKYAVELITAAAEKEYPEAMAKLCNMYRGNDNIPVNYGEALKWAQRLYEYYLSKYGENNATTLASLSNLASAYSDIGDYKKSLELGEKCYTLMCEVLGEKHPKTLILLNNLADAYGKCGDYKKAQELNEKCYILRCKVLGEEHPATLNSLNSLAYIYGNYGDYKKALGLYEKCYALMCKVLGEKHPKTLISLNNLACTYRELGDYKKVLELQEKIYAPMCEVLGEKHPDTLTTLDNMACTYKNLGDYERAFELHEKVYMLRCEILGERHPSTLNSLQLWAYECGKLGNYRKALELQERCYALKCEVFGEKSPKTATILSNLATTYITVGNHEKATELSEKIYAYNCETLGENHPDTVGWMNILAALYNKVEKYGKAIELFAKLYLMRCNSVGAQDPSAQSIFLSLITDLLMVGDNNTLKTLCKALYDSNYALIPELADLVARIFDALHEPEKAAEIRARASKN